LARPAAPALEYNCNTRIGVIVDLRWFPIARNADASVTPLAAIKVFTDERLGRLA
jgi:hypothetical protein